MDRESTLSLQPRLAVISQLKPVEALLSLLKIPMPSQKFPMPSYKPWRVQQIPLPKQPVTAGWSRQDCKSLRKVTLEHGSDPSRKTGRRGTSSPSGHEDEVIKMRLGDQRFTYKR